MTSVKGRLARKAAKSTAKHTARGTAAKLKRSPARAATLFGLGVAAGLLAGRILFGGPRDGTEPSLSA